MSKLVTYQPVSSITDWSKASQQKIQSGSASTTNNETNFTNILNVNGKGYLIKSLLIGALTSTNYHLRITIDGTITVLLYCTPLSAGLCCGVVLENLINPTSTNTYISYGYSSTTMAQIANSTSYPDTSNSKSFITLIQPIYFSTSLVIDVSSSSSSSNSISYENEYVLM